MDIHHLVKLDVPLKEMSSWRVGGHAEFFASPGDKDELSDVLLWASEQNLPVTAIGGGSNILVADKGVKGLVIRTRDLDDCSTTIINDHIQITCGAGLAKSKLLKIFLKERLAPALFLAGLPGDVGGGIVMNAGVSENIHPQEFHSIVKSFSTLKVVKKAIVDTTYYNQDIEWLYRKSKNWFGFIYEAIIEWPYRQDDEIVKLVREANRTRLMKQPLDEPSCGSVFVNPPDKKAAKLIDEAGLKGYRIGDAEVSEKHANFILNKGNATAQQIHQVILDVQSKVKSLFGVELKNEVKYIGEWTSLFS